MDRGIKQHAIKESQTDDLQQIFKHYRSSIIAAGGIFHTQT
jgi:hypothetical protein